ncbi:Aspartic protease [Hypsizygus marmoreus]|uniref:Aspartic protease n=1 Tax=Hypsizygus marmoreus TaxID=39966 RepID=A0A369JNQ2_HYPMA|nr:Aspartic protease [Hypsizygus marmoreus]
MKFHALPLALGLAAVTTSAYKVSFKQVKQRPSIQRRAGVDKASDLQLSVAAAVEDNGLDLNTVHDLIYVADINVGGTDYPVQLDTGSSDLWIKGNTSPLPNSKQTSQTYNLTYAIGWAYGHVSYAPVKFANLSIPSQAFLDVTAAKNPALGYGASGIVGLGFTSLSTIDGLVNSTSSSTGRSLLYNMFEANPEEPNFLAFALQRSTEADDEVVGSFSVGEYDPSYVEVANRTAIPTWPVSSPSRWNVLLDAVIVHDKIVMPATTVVGAPSNKAVILMDSGSSYTYAPKAICDAIYSSIPGAKYDSSLNQWVVPCDYEVDMALQIGGQVFPIHPLDVTPTGLTDGATCVGSFVPQTVSVGAGEFDWLVGDNFLRSVYSIYDFGDFDESGKMGNPFMKMLPIIDPDEASVDFHKARGGQPNTNITYQGLDGVSAMPSFNISQDISDSLDRIGRYLPAMLGVVALNALILVVLVIVGSVLYCRRRNPAASMRTTRGRMSPMPMNPRHSYIVGSGLPPPQAHTYEPVSMALTEDTFVPPSPAFHGFDGNGNALRPGDRPKSVA